MFNLMYDSFRSNKIFTFVAFECLLILCKISLYIRKRLRRYSTDSNSVWTDVTPERIRSVYTGVFPVDIWNPKPIEDGKHKVYLKIEINGGGSAGDFLDIRIINDNSDTTIFEHTNIALIDPRYFFNDFRM